MDDRIHIQDQSNDKKYFTIVPNFILNHSTATDQALYLQMKRIAGDGGVCMAGYRYFVKQLGIGFKRYQKSLTYLLEHNWITFIGQKKVYTDGGVQKVNVYRVNDIWKMNNSHYDKGGIKQDRLTQQGGVKRMSRVVSKNNKVVPSESKRRTIEHKEEGSSFKNKKPFYKAEEGLLEMRWAQGKWWCLPAGGGQWLEFAGREQDIIWQ